MLFLKNKCFITSVFSIIECIKNRTKNCCVNIQYFIEEKIIDTDEKYQNNCYNYKTHYNIINVQK